MVQEEESDEINGRRPCVDLPMSVVGGVKQGGYLHPTDGLLPGSMSHTIGMATSACRSALAII